MHWWRNLNLLLVEFSILNAISVSSLISTVLAYAAFAQTTAFMPEDVEENSSNEKAVSSRRGIIAEFGSEPLFGLTSFPGLIAVALPDSVAVISAGITNISSVSPLIARIRLPEHITDRLTEFKILNSSSLILCDSKICRLCTIDSEKSCVTLVVKTEDEIIEHLEQVTATASSDGRITLRFVRDSRTAAILRYDTREGKNMIEPTEMAIDLDRSESGSSLATAFSRKGYTFFVGSVTRHFQPELLIGHEPRKVSSVRITRICDRDITKDLESRIDMAVVCGSLSHDADAQSLAAEYDPFTDNLTIVIQRTNAEYGDAQAQAPVSVCSFQMPTVQEAFDSIWNNCQKVSPSDAKCKTKATQIDELPKHCLVYTHLADTMKPCSRFGRETESPLVNCEVGSFHLMISRYGWLEQFEPLNGTLIAKLEKPGSAIISVRHVSNDSAIFALSEDGELLRVVSEVSHPLWSKALSSKSKFAFDADKDFKQIYIMDKNRVEVQRVSCAALFESCDDLDAANWSDPLDCAWCVQANGRGSAISHESKCRFRKLTKICPPYIERVSPSSISDNSTFTDANGNRFDNRTLFEAYGNRFDRLHNAVIKVCNTSCVTKSIEPNKMTCIASLPLEIGRECNMYVEGTLGHTGPYSFFFEQTSGNMKPFGGDAVISRSASTKTVRAMASAMAVLILIILILLIICLVRRYQARQRFKRRRGDGSGSQIPFNTINGGVFHASTERNAYTGFNNNGTGYGPRKFNPYEKLFLEIDPKLKINYKDLTIFEEIGKGNFGVVYKGTYRDPSGITREVACKTIDSHSDGVITGVSEFLREGLIMANFNHPNVAQLIGISLMNGNCPLIVTDYLAKGDLRNYIVNPKHRLTLGILLNFGIEIAEGMSYLHEKQFIHRDLAARNCMLDSNLRVKIADFGLSRDVSRCGMYEAVNKDRGIPIRWMPIESLEEQQYTFKADVWAYGVVLWELATRGCIPYDDMKMIDILNSLKEGKRLYKPKGCPDILYDKVMLVCWNEDPNRRPTFYELKEMMQDVVNQIRNGVSGSTLLDSHYERVSPRSTATTPVAYPKPLCPISTSL